MRERQLGLGLIDVLISTAIIGLIASGSLLVYTSIVSSLSNSSLRSEAVSILNQEIEIVRNMPYDQVGTQNGVPSGVLLQQKSVSSTNGTLFNVSTTVRNIDDLFDGTLSGDPNDTAPADYKIVELNISCSSCGRFTPLSITTTVAPKNLESASNDGSLFINVFDASGIGVSGATVQVINNSATPTINLTDTTNASGILQLVGVPTSTQNYHVVATKSNYSSDQTYKLGEPANPNPINIDATVVAQTLTQVIFQIDKVATVNVKTSNKFCEPIAAQDFSLIGNKLIGANPDVLKFSTSSATDNQGLKIFNNIEWDTYSFTYNGASDLRGANPLSPSQIVPNSTLDFRFVLTSSTPNSVLITARNAINNSGIASSTITLTKTGFNQTKITGRDFASQTDWSLVGQYTTLFEIDTTSIPGSLKLGHSASSESRSGGAFVSDSSIGVVAWTNPNNASTSNDFYATCWPDLQFSESCNYFKTTNFGFNIPAGATITGIVVDIERKVDNNTNGQDASVKIVKGGLISGTEKASSAIYSDVDTYVTYGSSTTDLWGLTWTPSDINASNFGVAFTPKDRGLASGVIFSVDHVRITVYYSTSISGYTTSTSWLISQTFDLGSSTSKLFTLNWLPASQPPETGANSAKFQIASNNDQTTWNFFGPDGTANTFYATNGEVINNIHANNRYFRYKIFLKTDDPLFTPQIDDVDIEFTGICVPTAQALFNGLDVGTYDIQATAIGYQMSTTTVNITNPWQQTNILLSP